MKTPKVDIAKPKNKFNTPKGGGLVRKSLGQTPAKNLKKLTAKGADHVLSMVKDNEENIDFKNKSVKSRMSLPANVLSKMSPVNVVNGKNSKKSPKAAAEKSPEVPKPSKKQSVSNIASKKVDKLDTPLVESKKQNLPKTPVNKNIPRNLKTPVSVENNSSPIKQNIEVKKTKVPFNLNDSLLNKTPNEPKQKKKGSPAKSKPISPEVELGLQLEEALSPNSKKDKIKKMAINEKLTAKGKTQVTKKPVEKSDDSIMKSDDEPARIKKVKRRGRKNKTGNTNKAERKPSMLKHSNALNSVTSLLKATEAKKNDLLEADQNLFMQFNLVKQAKDSRGVYKILLPHCILPDNPEVCLMVPDLKGKRNEPEEAIDHYKELLKKNNVTAITEIIPFRMIKQEYSQYEERRKLTNRIDSFISHGSIMHAARLGRKFARCRKIVCPINFSTNNLKEEINKALKKVPIFCSGNGTSFSVKCGRRGMPAKQIADNIVAIGEFFANNEILVGEASNLSTIVLKTDNSPAFPIFVSTVTPNEVKKPKGKKQLVEGPVEDEVTTVQDATVVVYPSGNVKVNKRKNQENDEAVVQGKPSKKAKTNVKLGEVEFDSDESDDESFNGSEIEDDEDSEVSMDEEEDEGESDIEEDEDEEDDGDEDADSLAEEDEEDDDEQSAAEEIIDLSEKEYLQELRTLQDEASEPKVKKFRGKPHLMKEEFKLIGEVTTSPQVKKFRGKPHLMKEEFKLIGEVTTSPQVKTIRGNPHLKLDEFKLIGEVTTSPQAKKFGGKSHLIKDEFKLVEEVTTGPQGKKQQTAAQGRAEDKKGKQIVQQNKKETVKQQQQGGKNQANKKQLDNQQHQQNKGKPNGQEKIANQTPQTKGKQPFGQGKGRENSPQNKGKQPFGQGKGRENSPQNKGKPFGQGKGRENSPQNKGKPFGQGKGPNNKGSPGPKGNKQNFKKGPQNKGKSFGQGKGPNNKGSPGARGKKQQNFKKQGPAGKN